MLGPLLFLIYIYINDLENDIVHDHQRTAEELKHDLELINKWAYQWKISFNPDPPKQANEVLFSCKKSKIDHPDIHFNGSIVSRVNDQKHLGLILTPKLNFGNHLFEKIKRAKITPRQPKKSPGQSAKVTASAPGKVTAFSLQPKNHRVSQPRSQVLNIYLSFLSFLYFI